MGCLVTFRDYYRLMFAPLCPYIKVFISDYESEADLVVFRASYESQVRAYV